MKKVIIDLSELTRLRDAANLIERRIDVDGQVDPALRVAELAKLRMDLVVHRQRFIGHYRLKMVANA